MPIGKFRIKFLTRTACITINFVICLCNVEVPVVNFLLKVQRVAETDYAAFTCVVQTNGLSSTSVMWKFNNVTIQLTNRTHRIERHDLNRSATESILTISNVTIVDTGVYSCVAENIAGSDVADSMLSVIGKLLNVTWNNAYNICHSRFSGIKHNSKDV